MNPALQWKLVAGFLLVFVAGGMTGAYLGASHTRRVFFEPPQRGIIGARMRERLRNQLNLTPEQMTKISPIIDRTAGQLEEIRRETGGRVHDLFRNAHQEIAANLTDEQRAKLRQMEERHRRFQRHGFQRWSPSPVPDEREVE